MPSRLVRFDALGLGVGALDGLSFSFHMARTTCVFSHVRLGTALFDAYSGDMLTKQWNASMILPLRIGYTLSSRPKKTWFFYGAVADVYAEASGSLWHMSESSEWVWHYSPSVRIALCCEVDYYALGIRLEGGWLDTRPQETMYGRQSLFYLGLQARALAFGIGF